MIECQWRCVRHPVGLLGEAIWIWEAPDHANAKATLELMGFKRRHRQRLFGQLVEMEMAALAVLNTQT